MQHVWVWESHEADRPCNGVFASLDAAKAAVRAELGNDGYDIEFEDHGDAADIYLVDENGEKELDEDALSRHEVLRCRNRG